MEKNFEKARELTLPLIPLRGKVAFPNVSLIFDAGREYTIKAVEKASANADRLLYIVSQKDADKEDIERSDLYGVGVVCRVRQITKLSGGTLRVQVEGVYRAKMKNMYLDEGCLWGQTSELISVAGDEVLTEAYFRTAKALVLDVLGENGKITKEFLQKAENATDPD